MDVAEPAGIDDCGETDDDAAAETDDDAADSSIFFACAGAAAISVGENAQNGGVG